MKYAIIGSGVAGIAAVEAIRSVDEFGEITLIGDDPHGHYSRPGLAYYLTSEIHDRALFSKRQDDLQKLHFRHLKRRVKRVIRDQNTLEVEGSVFVPYDRLLLSLGASAIPLEIPGSSLEGVHKLDHLNDANQIIKSAKKGKTAVVIGGGITALELVEGLVARGMKVHYLLRGNRYWSNVLDVHESKIIEHRLMKEGVKLHYRSEVIELTGKSNRINAIRLIDGAVLHCDLLAYAIGIQPQTHLAKQAALDVDRGILVNEYMQTNDPKIFAAGDVAQVYDPITKHSGIESLWNPSREQGGIAGLNMAGRKKIYVKSTPFNVTRLAGLTTTIIGMVGRGKDEDLIGIARGDSETWRQLPDVIMAQTGFEVNRVRVMVGEQTLIGAIVMGNQTLSFPLQKIISNHLNISSIRDDLLAPKANIAEILVNFWAHSLERGLNIQEKTMPRNLYPSLPKASFSWSNSEQKTIPRKSKLILEDGL